MRLLTPRSLSLESESLGGIAGSPAVDQVPWQGSEQEPVGADGGSGEAGAVSAGHVRRDPRREPAGGRLRAYRRIPGGDVVQI